MPYEGRLLSGLTVLVAVVEAGTIARAAQALGLSASGVSRAVARLEARLGVRLLHRTTRSLTLTEEGRRFYERASPHLAGIEDAANEVAGAADHVQGLLRVNIDPFFSRIVLASHLATFLARYPGLTLHLFTRESVGDLVAEGIDLAVRFGEPPAGSLIARKLTQTRVLTVAAPDYLARNGRPRHPSQVAAHTGVDFYDARSGRAYDWEFRKGRKVLTARPRSRLMVSEAGAMLGACQAGAGLAQILELGTRQLVRSGALVELFPDWSDERFPLYALYPSRHQRAAKVRAFIDFCLEIIAASQP